MIKILQGNCIDKIQELKNNSIDCVVSSPPYFGLRNYGVDGQFGLEKTYQEYIANTIKVFETFKPKLKDHATIWWNVGDTYSSTRWSNAPSTTGVQGKQSSVILKKIIDIPEKSLMMIPNRVAIALQDAGWYIRSEIIWHKPNPMPESVRDRPTSAHEKIWLITKNKKYYYDREAIREPIKKSNKGFISARARTAPGALGGKNKHNMEKRVFSEIKGANKRNVWTITTKPFKDAHFATFPKDLIEPCIKAGCPEKGVVLDPFGGAGTTGIVAQSLNRQAILIELNKDYINIANKRINKELGMFSG